MTRSLSTILSLGWKRPSYWFRSSATMKATKTRPKKSDLSDSEISSILESNHIDVQLHAYARERLLNSMENLSLEEQNELELYRVGCAEYSKLRGEHPKLGADLSEELLQKPGARIGIVGAHERVEELIAGVEAGGGQVAYLFDRTENLIGTYKGEQKVEFFDIHRLFEPDFIACCVSEDAELELFLKDNLPDEKLLFVCLD